MLLDPESLVLLLEHHADVDIEGRSVFRKFSIVCVLHIASCPLLVVLGHVCCSIFRVKVLDTEETSTEIDLSLKVAVAVNHLKARHARKSCDLGVVCTEGRSDMHDTCTVFSRHVVSRDHLESALARIEPRDELLVTDACEFRSLESAVEHLERNELVARLVVLKFQFGSLRAEMCIYKCLSHDIESRLTCVWIE